MRFAFVFLMLASLVACDERVVSSEPASEPSREATPKAAELPTVVTELIIIDHTAGDGDNVTDGAKVSVHYTGWLYDPTAPEGKGDKFDSSHDRGRPFQFLLGRGKVIKGWDQGVAGMRVGGERRLIIPPDLAYGQGGFGQVIPANATLLFDVKLLATDQP